MGHTEERGEGSDMKPNSGKGKSWDFSPPFLLSFYSEV